MPVVDDQTHLDRALAFKLEANKYYTDKQYHKAIRRYHDCLMQAKAVQQLSDYGLVGMARDEFQRDASGDPAATSTPANMDPTGVGAGNSNSGELTKRGAEIKLEALDLIHKCYNNLAACILNGDNRSQKDYLRAVDYCDKVLQMDKNNEKAIYRKGMCLARANLHDKAIETLKLCPKNREAQMQIVRCEQALIEERKRRDDEIRRNFARAQARQHDHHLHANGIDAAANGVAPPPPAPMENGSMMSGEAHHE